MLEFEWDDAKAAANLARHDVSFAAATEAFYDPFAVGGVDDSIHYGETRLWLVGLAENRLLCVVYTERGEVMRLISARRATRTERGDYENQNSKG